MEPREERESVDALLDVPRLLAFDLWPRLRGILSSLENVPLRLRLPVFVRLDLEVVGKVTYWM